MDRLDRRTLFSAANVLRGIALLFLALAFHFSGPNLLVLYLAMAFIAILEGTADARGDRLTATTGRRQKTGSSK